MLNKNGDDMLTRKAGMIKDNGQVNAMDEMMVLDAIGDSTGMARERAWLFDHGFKEIFYPEGGDVAHRSYSGGFERSFFSNDTVFTVIVRHDKNGMFSTGIPVERICGRISWELYNSFMPSHGLFTSASAALAVKEAVLAGIRMCENIKKKLDKMEPEREDGR